MIGLKRFNTVELELSGDIPESEDRFSLPLVPRRRRLTTWDIERVFTLCAERDSIKAISIKVQGLNVGLPRGEAISRGIKRARAGGKIVVVHSASPGNIEYVIGAAADLCFIPAWGMLNLIGLKAEINFYKNALYRLGIEADLKGLGEYKSAGEIFTRDGMSEPASEMLNEILDDMYARFTSLISEGRGISVERVKRLIDSGPYTPADALAKGLIDGLAYEDEMDKRIEEVIDTRVRKINAGRLVMAMNAMRALRSTAQKITRKGRRVALISDSGFITAGVSRDATGIKVLGAKTVVKMLDAVEGDNTVKALVMRISSSGGSGLGSDIIANKLKSVGEKIPVVVSMSDVAASGGYMISLPARKIVAESTTLTGSIGIISGKFSVGGLLQKLGITHETIIRGQNALMHSTARGYTKDEEAALLRIMDALYKDFVSNVAEARGMDYSDAERVSQGRVWSGARAKEIGLVDEIGGIKEAVDIAAGLAGLPPDTSLSVKVIPKPRRFRLPLSPPGLSALELMGETLGDLADALASESLFLTMPFHMRIK